MTGVEPPDTARNARGSERARTVSCYRANRRATTPFNALPFSPPSVLPSSLFTPLSFSSTHFLLILPPRPPASGHPTTTHLSSTPWNEGSCLLVERAVWSKGEPATRFPTLAPRPTTQPPTSRRLTLVAATHYSYHRFSSPTPPCFHLFLSTHLIPSISISLFLFLQFLFLSFQFLFLDVSISLSFPFPFAPTSKCDSRTSHCPFKGTCAFSNYFW